MGIFLGDKPVDVYFNGAAAGLPVQGVFLGGIQVFPAAAAVTFPASDLLAFWKLADTSDSSGNGNTLTNNNNVAFVAGKIGNAAEFDGSNSLTRSMSVDFSDDFTLSLWCKPADVEDYGVMLFGQEGGRWNIAYTGDSSIDVNNGSAAFLNAAALPDQWHHVVTTRNSTTTKMWLNGEVVAQDDNQEVAAANTIYLGSADEDTFRYTGLLDAVGIWERVLSDAEIAALWNGGSGLEP
jgi:hypothetical protein